MIHLTVPVQTNGSAEYAKLQTYFWSQSNAIPIRKRPVILILPGGAYERTSDRESEPPAVCFYSMGFHTAVLRYSVAPYRYPVSLNEVSFVMTWLIDHSEEYGLDTDRIFIMGFSAGGHLAAMYSVRQNDPSLNAPAGRLAGTILCYPVISADPKIRHTPSLENLLGFSPDEFYDTEAISPELLVNEKTPAAFIWTTYTDESVPCENSLRYFSALLRHGVPAEFHCFSVGSHGLSLANELSDNNNHKKREADVQIWTSLCEKWIRRICAAVISEKPAEADKQPSSRKAKGKKAKDKHAAVKTEAKPAPAQTEKPAIQTEGKQDPASGQTAKPAIQTEEKGDPAMDPYSRESYETDDAEELIRNGMVLFQDVQERMKRLPNLDMTCSMQLKSDLKSLEKTVRQYRKNSSIQNAKKIKDACLILQTSAYHILRDSFDDDGPAAW